MSYQERRSIVNLISSILITTIYATYMMQRYPQASSYSAEVFHFWGAFFLILIPVSIAAKIIVQIIFVIINTIATRKEEPAISMTDERDKLIDLKATSISLYVFVTGFLVAMASLVFEQPPSVMFIILIGSGIVSEIVSDTAQFIYYRRGF